jgi:hypothetical protein
MLQQFEQRWDFTWQLVSTDVSADIGWLIITQVCLEGYFQTALNSTFLCVTKDGTGIKGREMSGRERVQTDSLVLQCRSQQKCCPLIVNFKNHII